MFYIGGGSFPSGPAYLEFRGLNLNGNTNAADGFFCRGSHHLRFISNSISNTGGSGIASIDCDYLTSDHNLINHNGYIPSGTANPQWYSWTSAISYNSNQWFDNYAGFHNIISNNIISGEVDQSTHHTDGNGIILDLSSGSYDPSTANTPPALILNNVVYGNGGRCIVAYVVTNFWIVNNTCFKNDLDTSESSFGSFEPNDSHDGYLINNIAVAYQSGHPPYEQGGTVTNVHYYADLYFGASNNFSYSDPSQFLQADPLFLNPPSLGAGGYANALAPSLLSTGLTLLPTSPALASTPVPYPGCRPTSSATSKSTSTPTLTAKLARKAAVSTSEPINTRLRPNAPGRSVYPSIQAGGASQSEDWHRPSPTGATGNTQVFWKARVMKTTRSRVRISGPRPALAMGSNVNE